MRLGGEGFLQGPGGALGFPFCFVVWVQESLGKEQPCERGAEPFAGLWGMVLFPHRRVPVCHLEKS